jgi:hypothetical protein
LRTTEESKKLTTHIVSDIFLTKSVCIASIFC